MKPIRSPEVGAAGGLVSIKSRERQTKRARQREIGHLVPHLTARDVDRLADRGAVAAPARALRDSRESPRRIRRPERVPRAACLREAVLTSGAIGRRM